MTTPDTRVLFIGLGVMGLPMALNIQRAGIDIVVHDVLPEAVERAADAGLTAAPSLADALATADVVITMLPNTSHVESVVNTDPGTLATCRPGTVHIDMSSISPIRTREIAAASITAGLGFVDAPVSGGVKGATEGTLSIMAGGNNDTLTKVTPVLDTMSHSVTHMGEAGTGQAAKVCNQVGVAINIQAMCEAFTLGRALGVDLGKLRTALLGGATASWVLDVLGEQILAGDDSAGFRISLQVKDLMLGMAAAHSQDVPLPGTSSVLDLYNDALDHDEGDNGNQSLYRVYERLARLEIAPTNSH